MIHKNELHKWFTKMIHKNILQMIHIDDWLSQKLFTKWDLKDETHKNVKQKWIIAERVSQTSV